VTVQQELKWVVIKLEGRMVGPWVNECRHAWNELLSSLGTRKLAIDLCGVIFVDEFGLELLRGIYRATGAEMIAGSPLTKHFADQVMERTTHREKGE
jgi:anti-anti-sigma regulatory factor